MRIRAFPVSVGRVFELVDADAETREPGMSVETIGSLTCSLRLASDGYYNSWVAIPNLATLA